VPPSGPGPVHMHPNQDGKGFRGREQPGSNWSKMNDLPELNLTAVLNTVLYLLEYTDYPGKGSDTVGELKRCMHRAISDLETARRGKPN
jgi:hypothetical protein